MSLAVAYWPLSNMYWLIRLTMRGLISDHKYSLTYTPTHISDVNVPAGTSLRRGLVKANAGGNAGAVQYELVFPMQDQRLSIHGFLIGWS